MKRVLFIDRDGTILEEPKDEQIDSFAKFRFVPGAIGALSFLRKNTDFEFVMVTNQDGLGTDSFPESTFWPTHNLMLDILRGEGVTFDEILIDRHFPEEYSDMRKPSIGLVKHYISNDEYDLSKSYVIGDRETDHIFANNIGCESIILGHDGINWQKVVEIVFAKGRKAEIKRITKETSIYVKVNLDGSGKSDISTGLHFFDHMLEQLSRHSRVDITIKAQGDLHVDEHHTIEDTAITLGESFLKALGDKRGLGRYGFSLPMDDSLCNVSIDLGGRPWIVWDVPFRREKVGDVPTEMFFHFFKSLSDSAQMNINIKASGDNDHHKIESVFKAFARAFGMALTRDVHHFDLPSTKGTL